MAAESSIMQAVPLARGKDGVFRVCGSRVTLDTIVKQFKSGATAEQIQEDFPSLALAEVYSTIAYYLQHRRIVEEYLAEQADSAREVRAEVERNLDTTQLRDRLRRRRGQGTS